MGGLAWPIRRDRAPGRKEDRPSPYDTAGGSCQRASWPARASEAREETKGVVLPTMAAEPAPAPSEAVRQQQQRFAAALKLLHPKLRKRFAGKR
eukprot:7379508-Prymnesium_polylepis.1